MNKLDRVLIVIVVIEVAALVGLWVADLLGAFN